MKEHEVYELKIFRRCMKAVGCVILFFVVITLYQNKLQKEHENAIGSTVVPLAPVDPDTLCVSSGNDPGIEIR